MNVSKEFSFSEDAVREWCRRSEEDNQVHLSKSALDENPFYDERIVPGMMVLDRVSGLITQWAELQDGVPVIARLSSVQFTNPIYFDEIVTVSVGEVEKLDDASDAYLLSFDAETDETCVEGLTTVYLV